MAGVCAPLYEGKSCVSPNRMTFDNSSKYYACLAVFRLNLYICNSQSSMCSGKRNGSIMWYYSMTSSSLQVQRLDVIYCKRQ